MQINSLKNLAMKAKNRLRGEVLPKQNIKLISKAEDELLYSKVSTMLSLDEDVLNPIAHLMDMNYYKKLDSQGKEKYFFHLVNKYKELSKRYYEEKRA